MPPKTLQEYTKGQIIGKYGCKYIKEGKHVPRKNSRGYPFMERHAFFECGQCKKEFTAHIGKVKSGWTKSCGCRKLTSDGISMLSNGERDPIHVVWARMVERCFDPKSISWKHYGARGISVCEEWKSSFAIFREWAITNGWEKRKQIDRINPNGNYEPSNCRFVTNKENSNNKREQHHFYVWIDGTRFTQSQAVEILGVCAETVRSWKKHPTKKTRKKPNNITFVEPGNA